MILGHLRITDYLEAVKFRRLFPGNIRFTFSLGEDSALFTVGARAFSSRKVWCRVGGRAEQVADQYRTVMKERTPRSA